MSLALVLSSRRQLAAEGAFAPLPSYRTPAYLAVQGKGCALAANPLGIDCDSEVAFRKCRMGFHAFLMGTRVGEASHPGPQNDEGSLAQALLQVLQTWQTKAAQRQEAHLHKPPKPEAPPRTSAGKGRGSGPPQSDLVSRLMQVLQAAMQNSWSEDRLVTKMLEKLQPWVSASRDPGEDRQEGQAPNPARSAGSRVQSLSLEPSAPGANKGPEQKKGWGKQGKGKTVESSFVAPTPKSVPKPKSGPHTSKFAAKVDQSEWDAPVVLMSPGQFKQALSDGSAVAGNLILARNDESLQEIQDLCNAFAFTQPLSFAQVTEHDKLLPCVSVWWKKGRDVDQHPQRVKLRITQITPSPGPDVRAPLTVTVKAPKGQPMAVVRIVAPEAYRKLFLKDQAADSPQLIIGEMANWTTCRASELTGGRWQQSQDKTGRVLTGFLRLPESTARALLANSGFHAIFCSLVGKSAERPNVVWVPRSAEASHEEYCRFASSQAQNAKQNPCCLDRVERATLASWMETPVSSKMLRRLRSGR